MIVAVEPAWELAQPLGVGAVGAGVGPLVLQDLDETLGFAVRLRAVGPRVRQPHVCGSGGAVEAAGDGVGLRLVGQDPAHAHATPAEGRERLLEEGGAARATLVGQDGDVGVTAVVVDGDV